jgi:AraC family transcriptional activator of pobA
MKNIPVHNIDDFLSVREQNDFYVNTLEEHVNKHHFIFTPHKHDFYLCVLFTQGKGSHTIDFTDYKIKAGSIFFLRPGQIHNWELSDDARGFVFFHSKSFYELNYNKRPLSDFQFFGSIYNSPVVYASPTELKKNILLFQELSKEYKNSLAFRRGKCISLIDLIYIDAARQYTPGDEKVNNNNNYLEKCVKLEAMVDIHFREIKSPSVYADKMNVGRKHLNRISMEVMNKTVSEMIADRVILEAKRMLVHSQLSVSQVAENLGYYDASYFNRFFKKHAGLTPLEFGRKNK